MNSPTPTTAQTRVATERWTVVAATSYAQQRSRLQRLKEKGPLRKGSGPETGRTPWGYVHPPARIQLAPSEFCSALQVLRYRNYVAAYLAWRAQKFICRFHSFLSSHCRRATTARSWLDLTSPLRFYSTSLACKSATVCGRMYRKDMNSTEGAKDMGIENGYLIAAEKPSGLNERTL